MANADGGALGRGRVMQVNVSRGGVPKTPVGSARVTTEGLIGDSHNDAMNHGGPMRAVCLYTIEQIERLAAEGHPVFAGAVGENLTLGGTPLEWLTPGAQLGVGAEVILEITSYTTPCVTIADYFNTGDFTRISHKLHPNEGRVYARVLREGEIRPGDTVVVWAAAALEPAE